MYRLFEHGVLPRLLLLLALASLLGLAPRFHQVDEEMRAAGKAMALVDAGGMATPQASETLLEASRRIANAASYQQWRSDLWELAGSVSLQAGEPQAAVEYLERAALIDREICFTTRCGLTYQGLIDRGDAYQQLGELSAAIESWLEAFQLDPRSTELGESLVNAYVSQGNYANAITVLQALVFNQPNDAQLSYRLGLFTATQDPEAAIDSLNRAAELEPDLEAQASKLRREILSARVSEDQAYSLTSAGQALASLGEWELAAEAFNQATLLRPDYSEAWAYLGEACQHPVVSNSSTTPEETNGGNCLSYLEKALELDPHSLSAHTFLSFYWKRKLQYDEALQYMRSAIDLDARNPAMQAELASLLAASGDLDEAYKVYQRAASLSPFDPVYQEYLVKFSMQYDYHIEDVALPIVRELVTQYPNKPEYLDLIAQVMIQQGDLESAERFLIHALQIQTEYAPAHLHLGLVYILRENFQDAYRELNRAISLDSDEATANQARRLLESYFP